MILTSEEDGPEHGARLTLRRMGCAHRAGTGMVRSFPRRCRISGFCIEVMKRLRENMTFTQFIPYTDRLDYLAPLANNVCLCPCGGEVAGKSTSSCRRAASSFE